MNDYEAIRNLLALYCHHMDDGKYDAWSELFTEDGVWGSAKPLVGRTALRKFIESYPAAIRQVSKHLTTNSVIDVTGETAEAVSDFVVVRRVRTGAIVVRGGRYTDKLIKKDGRWLFARRDITSTAWHPPAEGISHAYLEDWTDPSPELPSH